MPVYVIRAGETDMIKIGWSDEGVATRLRHLQTAHYELLAVVRVLDCDRGAERWMHRRFADCCVLGEWFRFHPDMLTIEVPAHTLHRHAHLISKFGGTGPLARSISVEPRLAIHWCTRGIPAKYWHRVVDAAASLDPPVPVSAHLLERLPAEDKPRTEAAAAPLAATEAA